MKYMFLMLCTLFLECIALKAQEGVFKITKGDTVFWHIIDQRVHVNIYQLQSPVYIVGVVENFNHGYVDIVPQYYLYACSMSSEQWIKSPRITVEKTSYYKQVEALEVWDVAQRIHYRKRLGLVKPWTQEVQKVLTGGSFVPIATCSKIMAINSRKPRTR